MGGFDPRFRFSAEDQDLCRRVGAAHPAGLWFTPEARVRHVYRDSLRDTLRRSAAYGAGHMVLREKIPGVGVLVFPGTGIQENLADKARKLGIPVMKFDGGA